MRNFTISHENWDELAKSRHTRGAAPDKIVVACEKETRTITEEIKKPQG